MVDNGKYLGVYLGVGGAEKTFKGCEEKYLRGALISALVLPLLFLLLADITSEPYLFLVMFPRCSFTLTFLGLRGLSKEP